MGVVSVNAVSDSGPLIHLLELNHLVSLNIFEKVFIPPEVKRELWETGRFGKKVKSAELTGTAKDQAMVFSTRFRLAIAESEVLALAKQLEIEKILTDDLDARDAAKELSLSPVGTIGVILASYKKKIISKQQCIEVIKNVKSKSSLFVTQDLIAYIIEKINKK